MVPFDLSADHLCGSWLRLATLMTSSPDNVTRVGQQSSPVDSASVVLNVQQEPEPIEDEAQILEPRDPDRNGLHEVSSGEHECEHDDRRDLQHTSACSTLDSAVTLVSERVHMGD